MSKTKTTKKADVTKATKIAKAPKAAPAKKTDASKPAPTKANAGDNGNTKTKKVSAIDAAAKLLAESKEPMGCKEMIEAMTAKGLWKSPGGKTPHATLYSAILREIATKGNEARFVKTERGKFAFNA